TDRGGAAGQRRVPTGPTDHVGRQAAAGDERAGSGKGHSAGVPQAVELMTTWQGISSQKDAMVRGLTVRPSRFTFLMEIPSEQLLWKLMMPAESDLEGYLDEFRGGVIWGWAWNKRQPNAPVKIQIWSGDTLLDTILAASPRQDLIESGKGDGKHAYYY